MLSSILLGLYISSLMLFSFVNHPVVYCILLLSSALGVSGFTYITFGFSWYLVLFCLVYVGGVYVLFIFISVHNPNPAPSVGGSALWFCVGLGLLLVIGFSVGGAVPLFNEGSHYLCSFFEGFTYCTLCLVLMVGFISVSVVVGEKDSFFR